MPKNRIIPVFIPHAGCSNTCVFCNQRKIAGILDPPTPENIKKLVAESLEKNESCCEVAFYGGSFTAIPEHMQNAYLSAISEFLPKLSGIRLSTRPDAMDDATANRLKSFGVTMVELGTQSMDNRVLNLSRRGHSAEDTVAAAECVKRNGLKLVLQIMPGLPGDTPEGAVETAKAVAELEPDAVRVYPVVVVEGTELADMWRRGEYAPLTLDAAAEVCAEIAEIFENQGIPIIRMGLNPSEELSAGAALAGAYHPAFGEMVNSRVLYRKVERMLSKDNNTVDLMGGILEISVAPSLISALIGNKKENEMRMKTAFNSSEIIIKADSSLFNGEIRIEQNT